MDIQQLKSLKILVVGEACIDRYHVGTCDRLSPEFPVPVFKNKKSFDNPGMASNVFAGLSNLGINAKLISQSNPCLKERYIDEKTGYHLLRVDSFDEVEEICDSEIKNIDLQQYSCIVVSDYGKGFLSKEIAFYLRENFEGPIFVDTKKKDLSCFSNCIVKINEIERDSLINSNPKAKLVTTLGPRGAEYKGEIYSPSFERSVFDVCGAGDTFLTALVIGYMMYGDVRASIPLANYCAGIAVESRGTYKITTEDLLEYKNAI
jgi:bifunctional ADP-heptose synthase (sugar kinase/adenylyltransferase)